MNISDSQYKILKPTIIKMPRRERVEIINTPQLFAEIERTLFKLRGKWAVDIETQGTQAADKNTKVVGVGISNGQALTYFDINGIGPDNYKTLLKALSNSRLNLIAHNVFFDAAFLYRDSGRWFNWTYDTYGLLRQLANEGFIGQTWGLKDAQINLLGWTETNERELDGWLVSKGYWKSPSKTEKPNYYTVTIR
jgi:hypothetical protein